MPSRISMNGNRNRRLKYVLLLFAFALVFVVPTPSRNLCETPFLAVYSDTDTHSHSQLIISPWSITDARLEAGPLIWHNPYLRHSNIPRVHDASSMIDIGGKSTGISFTDRPPPIVHDTLAIFLMKLWII